MNNMISTISALWIAQALVAAFLGILFTQSGLDKIFDRKGNLEWLTSHFANSPLARTVGPMFAVITLLEVAAGVLSALGAVMIILYHNAQLAFAGAVLAAIAITSLFFGQRVAKDYAGAATLVPYFILTILGIILLAHPHVALSHPHL